MKGIRHFLRDFTATAVREHLRSAIESTGGSPDLTKNEIELVRFICKGSVDWDAFLAERSDASRRNPHQASGSDAGAARRERRPTPPSKRAI
jgi:hypothetical protein